MDRYYCGCCTNECAALAIDEWVGDPQVPQNVKFERRYVSECCEAPLYEDPELKIEVNLFDMG